MIKRFKAIKKESLKNFLLSSTDISSNIITKIASGNGQFIVNDMNVTINYQLNENDNIEIVLPENSEGENIRSIKGDFEILYEDSYLLIINKENNIACIPTFKHFTNSLANYVLSYYKQHSIISNIHFVNRLDAATSGIVILAKNSYVADLMQNTKYIKKYILEVHGILDKKSGIIETGIRRINNESILREVYFDKINSKTSYEVIHEDKDKSLILATLHTGKTHQLRLHFNYIGHSIIGDNLYGIKEEDNILHLHSSYLSFIHPITHENIIIKSMPKWLDINKLIK